MSRLGIRTLTRRSNGREKTAPQSLDVSNMARQTDMSDLSLFNVPYILATSQRETWRRETLATAQAIANVLTDEGLATINLRDRFAVVLRSLT